MDAKVKELIDRAMDEGMRGAVQPRDVIVKLLSLPPNSEEVAYMKERATEMAHAVSGNKVVISGAIGIDLCSCDMNCKFCSFGSAWGLVDEDITFTKEEIIEMVREYVEAGATMITLRSTEFYDLGTLTEWLDDIRKSVPGDYLFNLNVGEMTPAMAEGAYQAGATCAYHVIRMREGIDTPFSVALRKETIAAITASPLRWLTCVEPIGIEHSDEELADKIVDNLSMHPYAMSVMSRVNVPGTPFEGMEEISTERLLQILAVVRLASGANVPYCGIHPAIPESLYSGGNGFTIERGANPRDTEFNDDEWLDFSVADAVRCIHDAGFECGPVTPDPRFRADGKNWWKMGDPKDFIMPDPIESAAGCCGKSTKKA